MNRNYFCVLTACVIALASARLAHAQTPPAFRLSDAAGNNITIDATGTVAFAGNATCVSGTTCSTSLLDTSAPGQILWGGRIGAFQIFAVVGISKPITGPAPLMDISLQTVRTTATGGSLSIRLTDANFNLPGVTGGVMSAGGTLTGTASVQFRTWFDSTNAMFGTGTLVGSLGPFSGSSFASSMSGPGPSGVPFSMTEEILLTLGPNSSAGGDFEFRALPAPLKVTCPAATIGQIGLPYSSALLATGGVQPYTYSIVMGSLAPFGLTLNPSTGAISGIPTMPGILNFTGQAADATSATATTGVVPCAIVLTQQPSANCASIVAVQGVPITPVTMTGIGGTGAPYTFSATGLPPGLSMASDGTIYGTPSGSGTFNYTVTVRDKDGNTGTVNCSVTVNPPPSANCVSVIAIQGVAITPVTMIGSGGTGGPYTFSAVGLPSGLTMSSTGTISGTPSVSGVFNYTITVTDKDGNTGTVNCSVTVTVTPTASCIAITAIQGVAITPVTMVGSGGAGGPYTFSATGLPAGVTMSSTGTISGTPAVSGPFSYTVTVTDKNGNTGTVNCSVVVAPPPTGGCTFTIGYWKNHEEAWPVSSLVLGGKTYTKAELLAILGMPTVGDSSLILAKQLIAAKLNIANGASASPTVQTAISGGDALLAADPDRLPLGVKNSNMELAGSVLDKYNNGLLGASHCDDGPPTANTASLGDRVWNDIDGDGIQEAGEAGLNGVTVELRIGATVVATTTTSGDGIYFFGSLPAGTYTVCTVGGVPGGFSQTYDLDGLATPNCATATLASGQSRSDVDFGYRAAQVCTASIGDFVWADDGDGIQETGELGIGGLTVKLYNGTSGALITTTVTASNGSYRFNNLCAGTYKVEAVAPSGKQSTIANGPGSTPANDSNSNPATVTLTTGQVDLTIDFGFRTIPTTGGGCTYTQGYWKNHEEKWPVSSLLIGKQTYTKAELLTIFSLPVRGDSSISLAHQLIAAKLNAANQALVPSTVGGFITQADTVLSQYSGKLPYGVKNATMDTVAGSIDTYNNGGFGATHCK